MQNAELEEEEESEENGASYGEGGLPDLFVLNVSYFCITSCQTC